MKNYKGFGHIPVGGEERPVYFGIFQAQVYSQLKEIEYHQYVQELAALVEKNDPFILTNLLFSALYAGLKYEKKEPNFDMEQVMFWAQEMSEEAWTTFFEILKGSLPPNAGAPTTPEPQN